MKNKFLKLLSFALAACMTFSLVPVSAKAAEPVDYSNTSLKAPQSGYLNTEKTVQWSIDTNWTLTISGNGEMPDLHSSCPYANSGTLYGRAIKKIVVNEGITSIGKGAFTSFENVTAVSLPNSLTKIDGAAFSGCESLTSVTIPGNVTEIGDRAFDMCDSLKSINIPSKVTSIGSMAFWECRSLSGNITLPESLTKIGTSAFESCDSITSINIPSKLTEINYDVFENCRSLKSINIPNTVTKIDDNAFAGCTSLTAISIPSSVTSLGQRAFWKCSSVKKLTLYKNTHLAAGNSLRGMGALTDIYYYGTTTDWNNDGTTNSSENYYEGPGHRCNALDIAPNTTIHFMNNSSETMEKFCPNGSTVNEEHYGNTISYTLSSDGTLTINSNTDSYYQFFYYSSSIKKVVINNGTTAISDWAFRGCYLLKSVSLPNTLTKIGHEAFVRCSSLTDINIPSSVTTIDYGAFDCSRGDPSKIVDVDGSSLKSITIPDSVTSIGQNAFYGCNKLEKVKLSNKLTNIEPRCFRKCSSLKSIEIPGGVAKIDQYAFEGCTSLSSVSLPDTMTTLGYGAFEGCSSLKTVTLPKALKEIDMNCFENCSGLSSIYIYNTVNRVEEYAFTGCKSLKDVYYYGTKDEWNKINIHDYKGDNAELLNAKRHYLNPDGSEISYPEDGGNDGNGNNGNGSNGGNGNNGNGGNTPAALPEGTSAIENGGFNNPNDTTGASYTWAKRDSDGATVVVKNGAVDSNEFISDGSYTYYVQADGTVMKDRLTYHPDGQHVIFFDANGHEVFNAFTHASNAISGEAIPEGAQYYFNVYGYMYVNTVTYDGTGTKLYYINLYGQLEHNGWFSFDPNANYGDDGSKWTFTGSHLGYAQFDGSLLTNTATYDYNGTPCYMQGNGEAAY